MSSSHDVVQQIQAFSRPVDTAALQAEVRQHLDADFGDLDVLLGHAGPSTRPAARDAKRKRRTLHEEITYWERKEEAAAKELAETSTILPELLERTQERLQTLLSSSQSLSLQRYSLADKLANLIDELSSGPKRKDDVDGEGDGEGEHSSVLEQMEALQSELARLEAGLGWATVLEQVIVLSEKTLSPESHHPSPLSALPHYRTLYGMVNEMVSTLPSEMTLLRVIVDVRDRTWTGLKDVMSQNLLRACEALKWPMKVLYVSVPAPQRRAFERAFQDLLYLQSEGESLGVSGGRGPDWSSGEGLYPLQAMVQPIELRFKYHFQGSRGTNRIDKPEWAFTNILDRIYEHQSFVEEYLQPLVARAGYAAVDVKSEFTMLLFPLLLDLLRARIPNLLDHPALLAHTIYQTIVFDDAVRDGGFNVDAVSINEGLPSTQWEGLAGVILREHDWYDQWLAGEKKFADAQLNGIISSSEAWDITDEVSAGEEGAIEAGLKSSISSRQIKALVEQIIDRYSPLPALEYKLPFLTTIQLPLLDNYLSRISGSLDAFESLSSAFARVVPGALSGNTRSGVHIDQTKLTGGTAGLARLMKALISAEWITSALRVWADDVFFVEMSTDLRDASQLRWKIQYDALLPSSIKNGDPTDTASSVFDLIIDKYATLCSRAEDMIVRHITVEVENDLKQHLTRRWDQAASEDREPDASLLNGITALSTHLGELAQTLPILTTSRLYRRIVSHVSNHIQQRAVYAGWSKFSAVGGKDFADEITDWRQASASALPKGMSVDAPWTRLVDISRVLSLPTASRDLPTFSQAMAAAWSDGQEALQAFTQRLGLVDLNRADLQGVLRRRIECWR